MGPEDTHVSHPPPHPSVTGSLNSLGSGDGDTTSLLLPSALFFWGKGVKSSQRLKGRTQGQPVLPSLGVDERFGHFKMYDVPI